MAMFAKKVQGEYEKIRDGLRAGIQAGDQSVYLVDESEVAVGNVRVSLCVFSKFYLHESAPASLTIQVIGGDDEVSVVAIGAGVSPNKLEKPGMEDKLLSLASYALNDILSN